MRAIYFDTETTGTRPEKDRIIEIAAYDPENNASFVRLINPGIAIPPEASAIHKITDDMVAGSPGFETVGIEFRDFCGSDAVLIAHNNDAFDKLFIASEFSRAGIPLPEWKYLCTLKWARKYRPDLPRHSLQSLREVYGIPPNQAHRALDDVVVLRSVFSMMIDDLPIQTVFDLLQQAAAVSRMPFGKYQGKPLEEVPKDYLQWLLKSGALDKPENGALKAQLEKIGKL